MIAKLGYADIQGYGIQATIGDKKVKLYMRVQVTEFDIQEAIESLRGNKFVVALEYVGNMDALRGLNLSGLRVSIKREVTDIDVEIDAFMTSILEVNDGVKVIFQLPEKYSNMQKVVEYSEKYKNISFCGGYMLRVPGAKLGCVQQEALVMGKQGSRSNMICDGCACVMETKTLDEYSDIVFLSKEECIKGTPVKSTKSSSSSSKKEKKVVSSIFELDKDMEDF